MRYMIAIIVTILCTQSAFALSYKSPIPLFSGKTHTVKAFKCPPAPHPILEYAPKSRYNQQDPSRSTVDAKAASAYNKTSAPLRDYTKNLIAMANKYHRSNGTAIHVSACVVEWISVWAKADALSHLTTFQSQFGIGQDVTAISMAWLQVRDSLTKDDPHIAIVTAWLVARARELPPRFAALPADSIVSHSNIRAWNALAASIVAVISGDELLYHWGMESMNSILATVTTEGFLPSELKRSGRTRDYHLFALSALVLQAEIAAVNGDDMYSKYNNALHRIITSTLASLDNPSAMEVASQAKQNTYANNTPPLQRMAWLEIYYARFPLEKTTHWLNDLRPLFSTSLGGNMTALFAL